MSRAGYSDDLDPIEAGRWRGRVASAIRGERGQQFLRDTLAALDAMPDKRLIASELEAEGQVCTLGCTLLSKGIEAGKLDPEDHDSIGKALNISSCLVREVEYENDEGGWHETPEQRWQRIRKWVASKIKSEPANA